MNGESILSQNISVILGRVDTKNVAFFSRQLATLLSVGLPLLRALSVLAERTSVPAMKSKISYLAGEVSKGRPFSDALADDPRTFSEFYVNTVRAGEAGGILQKTLRLLADYLEKEESLRYRLKSVLLYPGIILVLAFIVLAYVLIWVVPEFRKAYEVGEITSLPWYTQAVLNVTEFLDAYLFVILGVFLLFGALLFALRRVKHGKRVLDWIAIKIPITGRLLKKVLLYRVARLLHLLLESGVSVQRAMEIAAGAAGNHQMKRALSNAAASVLRGRSVEASLREERFFPDLFVDMIGIGEEAGAIGSVMQKLAATFEEDVDVSLNTIGIALEPVMVILVGTVVVIVAISIFVPYLSLSDAFLQTPR